MDRTPSEVLNRARQAFDNDDYENALKDYLWFFDNALDIEPSYAGVRLSYCLGEWADLGSFYAPAKEALVRKKNDALADFRSNQGRGKFRDYACICEYLKCSDEAVEEFKVVHNSNKILAKRLFITMYEALAERSEWELCSEYIEDCLVQYRRSIGFFDDCMPYAKKLNNADGESIERDSVDGLIKELRWIFEILKFRGDLGQIADLAKQMDIDLISRGYPDIAEKVNY